MAAKHTLHVALTKPLLSCVTDRVAEGHFATASEVVRNALRLMIDNEKEPGSKLAVRAAKKLLND